MLATMHIIRLVSLLSVLSAPSVPPESSLLLSITRHSEYQVIPGYCEQGPHTERQIAIFVTGEVVIAPPMYAYTQCRLLSAADLAPLVSLLRSVQGQALHPDYGVTSWNQPYEASLQVAVPSLSFWGFVKRPAKQDPVIRIVGQVNQLASFAWGHTVSITED